MATRKLWNIDRLLPSSYPAAPAAPPPDDRPDHMPWTTRNLCAWSRPRESRPADDPPWPPSASPQLPFFWIEAPRSPLARPERTVAEIRDSPTRLHVKSPSDARER